MQARRVLGSSGRKGSLEPSYKIKTFEIIIKMATDHRHDHQYLVSPGPTAANLIGLQFQLLFSTKVWWGWWWREPKKNCQILNLTPIKIELSPPFFSVNQVSCMKKHETPWSYRHSCSPHWPSELQKTTKDLLRLISPHVGQLAAFGCLV